MPVNEASMGGRRRVLVPTLFIIAAAVLVWVVFTELWTKKLWFDSVAFPQVFGTQLAAQVILFVVFFSLMALAVGGNMWLAFRLRPTTRRGSQSALLDRYRDLLEANKWLAILLPAVFFGLLAGVGAAAQSLKYLAWWNQTPFGTPDAYFGMDAGFYVFAYPVLTDVLSFGMGALFFGLVAAGAVHFAVGGLRIARGGLGPESRPARLHLSVITGLLLVLYGLNQLLGRYALLVEQDTLFTGMQYTDDHARVTAKLVMAVISFLCAALFFANGFLRRSTVPFAGLVLMLISGLIIGMIYPAVVRSFQVLPNEPDKEAPYIQKHIDATRTAYGVADTQSSDYDAVSQVKPGQLKADAEALPGIRLIDPALVSTTFDQLQQVKSYYSFPDALDVDRYTLDGTKTDAVVAARELDQSKLPDQSWNNLHTVYTHGYGLVASYGNRRSSSGDPVWIEKDLPSSGDLGAYEGRVYFGEQSDTYAVVGREQGQAPIELDTPGGSQTGGETYNTYAGTGGVPIGNAVNRLLYATHFMDFNLLLSDRVNSQSRILYDRTPKERVQEVAPWLTLDSNIYPAVVDSRLVWIVDGYTTSSTYPNSQLESLRGATDDAKSQLTGSQADTQVNYMRNSVKAVVDATNGTVTLYAWDPTDPILQTWEKAFPGSLKAKDQISPDLMAHLRYPEDLFKVQRQVLARYHMTDARAWYNQSDLWQVPADPSKNSTTTGSSTTSTNTQTGAAEPPYYLSIKWPGDKNAVFSQTAVFVPNGRSNLAAYLSVVSDATSPNYGKLRVLRMSGTHQVDGPGQTFSAIATDQTVANLLRSYLNQGSADAKYGNLLTLPMGAGLLYVMPIYTIRQGGGAGSYPALKLVAVRFGEHVGIGETLQAALDSVFSGDAGADTGEGTTGGSGQPTTPTTPTTPSTSDPAAAAAQMKKAEAAFTAAEAALRVGDLAEYQKQVGLAKTAVEAALKALGR